MSEELESYFNLRASQNKISHAFLLYNSNYDSLKESLFSVISKYIFKDEGIILEDESKYYIKNLPEVTSFLTYDDFEQLDFKELYILWKIRSDNSFRIKEFYLKEFYWQGEKN